MYYHKICAFLARYYVLLFMHLTLLIPLPRLPRLTTILRLGWLAWLAKPTIDVVFAFVTDVYEKVSFMVGNVLFIFNILTNVVTIVEVMLKEKQHQKLLRLECEVDALLKKQVDISGMELKVWLKAFYYLILQTTYDLIHLGISATGYRSPVFYHAVHLTIVQRTRYIQILLTIQRQTERSSCLIDALQVLVRANRSKYTKYARDVWQPYTLWEYENLNSLRLIQGRMCELHQSVSNCFGWSIIVLLFTTFFTVVSNIFWCIIILKNYFESNKFFYNTMTMFRLGTLAAALLVFGDRAGRNNTQISGLIYKLAKPLGNKAYNDLVSSFSQQCLHEGLKIDVKGFFTLDIPVLGNMIALTVTYLIILVQFMVTEGEIIKEGIENNLMSNTTMANMNI